MFPIRDDQPRFSTPYVNYFIIALNVLVFVFFELPVQFQGPRHFNALIFQFGFIPEHLTSALHGTSQYPISASLLTIFTSMFLHGGWGHILGNALFFWVFGNNIEDSLGHFRFLVFYLVCGLAAAAAHILAQPASPLPTVGASGAISGILGAYLVLYPRVRVRMLFFFIIFFKVIPIPAWLVLIWWFFWQLVAALPELKNGADLTGGVAVWAHLGGFVTGVVLVKIFENRSLVVRRTSVV